MKIVVLILATLTVYHPILTFGEQHPREYQSHQSIITAVERYLNKQTRDFGGQNTIEITPLDHRLRLKHCADKIETFSPPGANIIGKTTVGVRCTTPHPWTLYVSANISNYQLVAVASKDLKRGTVISSNSVMLDKRDTSSLLRGHFASLNEVIGQTTRRSIQRNQVFTPNSLTAPKSIRRGQTVTILAGNENIQVRMKGKALRHGNPGDLIPVQNLTSKKKLQARVISEGTVRID
jgi:flagella basal body P-ring formation protein FlgA